MKNKTIYRFPTHGNYSLKFPEMPLRITISCDGSNAIISTSKKLSLLYFRKLFNKEKIKKMLKQEHCDLYKNIGPIEMHPFFDEKEYFAGAYENSIFVLKVSKNSLNINDAKKMTNQHSDNIRFLAWQYKQNGLLASTSSDRLINFYDIRSTRNPVYRIQDDDIVKSIKFSTTNNSLLATGYDRRLKIWDLKKSTTAPFLIKEIFDGAVDILEWHMTQNFLLCGSKQNNIIKIFTVKDKLELIFEIKIKDVDEQYENNTNTQKILKAYFIQGNGLIAVCEKKAFIYHLGNNFSNAILDQILEFGTTITNFKTMTNNLNNHYFVYTDKENNFVTKQYQFDETVNLIDQNILSQNLNDRNFSGNKKLLFVKEIENIKKKYHNNLSVENKSDKNVYILKLFQDLITIKLKVTYNENYPKVLPSVDFENKYESFLIDRTLITIITNEVYLWQNCEGNYKLENISVSSNAYTNILEKLIANLIKILNSARIQIEENADDNAKRILKKQGKVETEKAQILPYIRTSSFTWGPQGQLLTFHFNKIDFKQLKASDKTITNFNNLEDWIKFCEASDARNKFSRSENKLIEEETDFIITEKLRSIVDWKSILDYDDSLILNSINRADSLPNLFMNSTNNFVNEFDVSSGYGTNFKNTGSNLNTIVNNSTNKFYTEFYNNFNNYNIGNNNNFNLSTNCESTELSNSELNLESNNNTNSYLKHNFNISESNSRKKSILIIHQIKQCKDKFILENLKLKLLSKDHFYTSINSLLNSINHTQNVTTLTDILEIIYFNINCIIDPINTSELLIIHHKQTIMSTIKTLEINKNYEYLYICILLITSRIFDNVISDVLKVPSLINEGASKKIKNVNDLNSIIDSPILKTPIDKRSNTEQTLLPISTIDLMLNRTNQRLFNGQFKRKKVHKNSEISVSSERIIPTRNIAKNRASLILQQSPGIKSLHANLYKLSRNSSIFDNEASAPYDSVIYDENSEYRLHDEENIINNTKFTYVSQKNEEDDEDNSNDNIGVNKESNFILDNYFNSSNFLQRDLVKVFGDVILSKFIDFLYFYSNELYRMNRIVERAELIKFLFLISSKLKINRFKSIIESTYVNLNPIPVSRNRRLNSYVAGNDSLPKESESLYNRFKNHDDKNKKKIFKTRLLKIKEYINCDICGERIKIGTISLFSIFYNIKGHYDHVMDFIQNNVLKKSNSNFNSNMTGIILRQAINN